MGFLVGLTVPTGLFGESLMMPVSFVLLVSSSPVSLWGSLPATAPWTTALLPAQVKEELSGWLLNRQLDRWREGWLQNKSTGHTETSVKLVCSTCALLSVLISFWWSRSNTSSAAALKLICRLSVLSLTECLYGFSVTSCGCFTSSDGSMVFMGIMLKAYKYCKQWHRQKQTQDVMVSLFGVKLKNKNI